MQSNNYPRAKQVLKSLIAGVDPATGSDLPRDSILNRVDVIRALLSSVDAIEQVTARAARRALLPDGVGQQGHRVFTGKIVEAGSHTWVVEVDRVWKGRETLTHSARLMDVYAKMDCESFFKEGERYLFFAIVAKGPREVFYHPQVCNWTNPLHSKRVVTPDGASVWLEDLIIREHGSGEPPGEERGSGRLP